MQNMVKTWLTRQARNWQSFTFLRRFSCRADHAVYQKQFLSFSPVLILYINPKLLLQKTVTDG